MSVVESLNQLHSAQAQQQPSQPGPALGPQQELTKQEADQIRAQNAQKVEDKKFHTARLHNLSGSIFSRLVASGNIVQACVYPEKDVNGQPTGNMQINQGILKSYGEAINYVATQLAGLHAATAWGMPIQMQQPGAPNNPAQQRLPAPAPAAPQQVIVPVPVGSQAVVGQQMPSPVGPAQPQA